MYISKFIRFLIHPRMALLALGIVLTFSTVGYSEPPNSDVDPTENPFIDVATTGAEQAHAMEVMMDWMKDQGVGDPHEEWHETMVVKDTGDMWHFKMDQIYQDIPVLGGHLSIHMKDGSLPDMDNGGMHGQYMADSAVDTNPKISMDEAMRIVHKMLREEIRKLGGQGAQRGNQPSEDLRGKNRPDGALLVDGSSQKAHGALEIHPGSGPGNRKLSYHISMEEHSANGPVMLEAWVSANEGSEGQILEFYNNAQTTHCINGTGQTFYQGSPSYFKIAYWPTAATYVLNDNCLRIGVYDMYGGTSSTYQASSSNSTFGNFSLSSRETTNADTYWSTVQTNSFFYYILGRNWVDGSGGPRVYQSVDGNGPLISARNHYGSNYNNAFWDGQKINLGDGNGISFRSLTTLDIVAHEWVHGLTQFTGGLIYNGESGALNESFSDIFGAMAERYWKGESSNTWKIGEGARTPLIAGDALRYMDRPTNDGVSRDHYSQRYTGSADNGGVHWNSGIQNNAFYLLATGGCHRFAGCMSGSIGANAATQIFWRALRYYIIPTDNFFWARRTTQWAAADLYGFGSTTYNRVVEAWNRVGAP
ncbi:MAG TPA: M4 family metallopeptidase [Nitrospiria bacterium]